MDNYSDRPMTGNELLVCLGVLAFIALLAVVVTPELWLMFALFAIALIGRELSARYGL